MRALRILALLALVQVALYLGWRALTADDIGLRPIDGPMPSLTLLGPDDTPMPSPDGTYLLHVWATWCPPCRDELPGLLDFAAASPVPVLAVATDPDWRAIRDFVGPAPSPALRRADARAVAEGLDVDTLPVTFVVIDGRLRARLDGARDWTDRAVRAAVFEFARR